MLLSLCVEPSSNIPVGEEEELIREKIRLVLEELIRGMESRVGPPFGDLARCYKSIEALLVNAIDEERRAQLRLAAGMLIDLSSHVRKAVESFRR